MSRAVAGLVVAPFLTLASAVAPTHAHEYDADHAHAVVHSHFQPHEQAHEQDGAEVEPGSEHVVWLDNAIIHTHPFQFDPPPPVVAGGFELVETASSWSVIAFNESAPVHGPPSRSSSLRGPPSFPA